tara:strand:+ start:8239 stop:9144 length:906 start_codon:yes stop_codon:yes gene_type:complete
MVGSSLINELRNSGYKNLIFKDSNDLDLRNQKEVELFFKNEKPNVVIIAAAKVGGIQANNIYRAEFIYDNLMIQSNLINSSYISKVDKLIFLGSSCIYPKLSLQPIKEEYLLSNTLEYTNEPYAIAKIAGIKLCENYFKQYGCNFLSLMPTNLFGYNDNFDLSTSHVLPALLRKFHEAKNESKDFVEVWGSGNPKREFMFVDDLSNAIKFVMENIDAEDIYKLNLSHINIGTGKDISIKELSIVIKKIVGYKGEIIFNQSKPDGTLKKLLNIKRINDFGWFPKTDLNSDIKKTYNWFKKNV